jgi:hypothetical protein
MQIQPRRRTRCTEHPRCTQHPHCSPVPGYVSPVIYRDDLGAGWGWRPYSSKNTQVRARGEGLNGGAATCLTSSRNGAVVFNVRDGFKPGYQPFAAAQRLDFWIKSNTKSADPYASSTPKGQPPPLKIFLMNVSKSWVVGEGWQFVFFSMSNTCMHMLCVCRLCASQQPGCPQHASYRVYDAVPHVYHSWHPAG